MRATTQKIENKSFLYNNYTGKRLSHLFACYFKFQFSFGLYVQMYVCKHSLCVCKYILICGMRAVHVYYTHVNF